MLFETDAAKVRTEVLNRAIASLGALEGVEAIYLSGSLAEGVADAHSDIDLRVVVSDAAYESVLARREHLPTTWGPFLFHQTVAAIHTVSYYESLTKADVFYYAASAVVPSPWFNLGTQVVHGRSARLETVLADSAAGNFVAGPGEVVGQLHKCLAGLVEGTKRLLRGERLYGTALCSAAVHHLLIADDLLAGRAPLGSSKRERRVAGELTERVAVSVDMPRLTFPIGQVQAGAPSAEIVAYVTALAGALRMVLDRATGEGHCADAVAARLRLAVTQMVDLAGAPAGAAPLEAMPLEAMPLEATPLEATPVGETARGEKPVG